jgi:glycosyltransferase involved in cell wall biosynthesis
MMLQVLGLNWADEVGQRFNGLNIVDELNNQGVEYKLFAGKNNTSNHPSVVGKEFSQEYSELHKRISNVESRTGFQSRLFWTTKEILKYQQFIDADLIHIHIIHNGWFRLEEVLNIGKPILWTIHDPWITTGHCIYPSACSQWEKRCKVCPDLARPMAVSRDRTMQEVIRKEKILRKLKAEYHVSTNWTKELLCRRYPFIESRIRVIPFGIDTSIFQKKKKDGIELRKKLGISQQCMVILLRTSTDHQKNLNFAKKAIEIISTKGFFHVFSLEQRDHFKGEEFSRMPSTDFGWVSEDTKLAEIYAAADVLLMPSTEETFGMMALESMSCGTPVIYRTGGALDEVVGADSRFTFTKFDTPEMLAEKLIQLHANPSVLESESNRVTSHAKNSQLADYAKKISKFYLDVYTHFKIS